MEVDQDRVSSRPFLLAVLNSRVLLALVTWDVHLHFSGFEPLSLGCLARGLSDPGSHMSLSVGPDILISRNVAMSLAPPEHVG